MHLDMDMLRQRFMGNLNLGKNLEAKSRVEKQSHVLDARADAFYGRRAAKRARCCRCLHRCVQRAQGRPLATSPDYPRTAPTTPSAIPPPCPPQRRIKRGDKVGIWCSAYLVSHSPWPYLCITPAIPSRCQTIWYVLDASANSPLCHTLAHTTPLTPTPS